MYKETIHSNIGVFYQIASQNHELMHKYVADNRRPISNDGPGWIISVDPDKKSLKCALITIVFCCVCLEAALHILIVERCGIDAFRKNDYTPYEEKLKLLGYEGDVIASSCKRLRAARREVVHEKAYVDQRRILWAQDEATFAITFLENLLSSFGLLTPNV